MNGYLKIHNGIKKTHLFLSHKLFFFSLIHFLWFFAVLSLSSKYIHTSKLSAPESPWYRMSSSSVTSRIECATRCQVMSTCGSCGAFVYDDTLSSDQCVTYSTDGSCYTQAITDDHRSELYIAVSKWVC